MKTNKKIKIDWGDEVVLPNGQIVQPKMLTPDESRVLNTQFMPAWQREFNDVKRNAYATQMKEGLWDNDNLSVVRITPKGEVCDGGHRTSAAEMTDFTLAALLIKNVPPKVFLTTDIQKTRGVGVFISGTDRKFLSTLSITFLRANLGYSPISYAGNTGSRTAVAINTNDPAAFLHANRAEIEEYAKIGTCLRSRTHDTVNSHTWGVVAAIARLRSGSDAWVYSINNLTPCIVEIKDYVKEARDKHITRSMQQVWIFCRLMSDFREKMFGGKRWNVRQMAQLIEEYSHALKGHFKKPEKSDYIGAANDLFKYAEEAAARKAAKEGATK